MQLSLVDVFRCPAEHEETALVLSVDSWRGTRVDSGTLGCPTCHARYAIKGGAVFFQPASAESTSSSAVQRPSDDDAVRLLAQLDLRDPGGVLLLTGRYAGAAFALADLDTTCLIVDAEITADHCVSLHVGDRMPVAGAAIRAAAVGRRRATSGFLIEVARSVRPGGRVVAPAGSSPPSGVSLIARDEVEWVGEVDHPRIVVPLRRSGLT